MWQQTRSNHRRDIRRALKNGYTVRMDEDWEHLDEFAEAYDQSMARLDAEEHWYLDRDYFHGLKEALGCHGRLCVAEFEGSLAAGAIITDSGSLAEYHLAGTMNDHLRAAPAKLIIHHATGWARDRGHRILHLGATARLNDSLMNFKLGFSPDAHSVHSWRVIANQVAYEELVAACSAGNTATIGDGTGDADEFFPRYRRPY